MPPKLTTQLILANENPQNNSITFIASFEKTITQTNSNYRIKRRKENNSTSQFTEKEQRTNYHLPIDEELIKHLIKKQNFPLRNPINLAAADSNPVETKSNCVRKANSNSDVEESKKILDIKIFIYFCRIMNRIR